MERLTKHDSDIGYYVEEDMANQEATSNIDGRTVIQGDAITKLAELENMTEEGELVRVVRCKDCKWLVPSEKTDRLFCGWHSDGDLQLQIFENDYCNEGERR